MTYKPTQFGPEYNPGNAKWCPDHGRLECTKKRNRGRGPCHQAAIKGTNACRIHGGSTRKTMKAKGEAAIAAATMWTPMGSTSTDPSAAVLGILQMSYYRVAMYGELLRRQVAEEGATAGGTSDDDPDASGLIGFRYGMGGKDGITYVQSEEVRALVMLEAAERDRVVKYSKVAHDMGISSRMMAMAERWGDAVALRISLVLDGLNLTPEQAKMVPALLKTHLGSMDMAALESGT